MASRRPLGLVLFSVLLLILALRVVGWAVIGGLIGHGDVSALTRGLVSLPIAAALVVDAIGLLRLQEWARWLTLIACSVYFGAMLVNLWALWPELATSRLDLGLGVLNGIAAVVVLCLSWWYLNRQSIRRLFRETGEPKR